MIFNKTITRRAVTLVELVVVSGIMVVVIGLALGIASTTEKAGNRISKRQGAILYCQTALQQAADVATSAIDPEAINGVKNRTPLAPVLTEKELGVMRYLDLEGPTIAQTLIKLNESSGEEGGSGAFISAMTQPLAETAHGPVSATSEDLGRIAPAGFVPSIEFGYAAAPAPGQPAQYAQAWSQPGLPDLIRITVRARFTNNEESPVELQTAVIPGFVRTATASEAPATVPTTAPISPAISSAATTSTQGAAQ